MPRGSTRAAVHNRMGGQHHRLHPSGERHCIRRAEGDCVGERDVHVIGQSRVPVRFGESWVFILRELKVARQRMGLTAAYRPAALKLPQQQPERDHVRGPDRGALEQQRPAALLLRTPALRARVTTPRNMTRSPTTRGSPGGFNWLSQRLTLRSCDAQKKPCSRSCRCGREAWQGTSACRAPGTCGPVLGGDRSRGVERTGCRGGWCPAEHWCPVVPQGWRDAASRSCAGVGALSVVHRAGGDRSAARWWLWGARDRASARSRTINDLQGAAAKCCIADRSA